MKLLILGGAGLTGTAITLAALDRGHEVVAVHRMGSGTLAPVVHPRLTEFVRNRATGHAGLEQLGPFDAIIDTSARLPAIVADAVIRLDTPDTHWLQLSSVSAYADLSGEPVEGDALARFDDRQLEARANRELDLQLPSEYYGPAKANCERMLARGVRGSERRVTLLRPVLITGAYDDTWRIPYWVERIARGGRALAPPADAALQVVDARDLATFALDLVDQRRAGAFNVAPANGSTTFADLVAACQAAARTLGREPAEVVHARADWLLAHDVEPWSDLPGWIPDGLGVSGLVHANSQRALAAGFRARPLAETVAGLVDWIQTDHSARVPTAPPGLDPEREQELIERCQ